jgi:2,4-dienoyl-CoA reductase-like NADH-dependent reductase (Old Yellow Enzyme family)
MPTLFSPIACRSITLPNRVAVSPMCQYSAVDGLANDWHLVHLGSRAVGGAGLVMAEATAVLPEGRITPNDLGLWNDEQIAPLARIVTFLHEQGAHAGIQLAHAGRKASRSSPFDPAGERLLGVEEGGWSNVVAPSSIPFAGAYADPHAMDAAAVATVKRAFVEAAGRALTAGFDIVEIHAAHGYLFHEFLSPLSNHRTDRYGGSFENRTRLLIETVDAVRTVWPAHLPLFVRVSATDWAEGEISTAIHTATPLDAATSWTLEQSIALARVLKEHNVDLVDCSSGGNLAKANIVTGPGYQTPFAEAIRREAGIPTAAVGQITDAEQAERIVASGQADLVLLAREFLRDPYWPLHAADTLHAEMTWPAQYLRAAHRATQPRQAKA